MTRDPRPGRRAYRDPYAGLPTDELDEPVLPRWFVLIALATVPVAAVVFVVAFFGGGGDQTPVAARRPPPADDLTSDVGEVRTGTRAPVAHDPACAAVAGWRVAGTDPDRQQLGAGLDALCAAPAEVLAAVEAFASEEPVLRFAAFERTAVDVAGEPGVVYVNARYARSAPESIAPLLAYQAVLVQEGPASAAAALAARRAELATCEAVLPEPSRACEDAAALLELDDPVAELRTAGFR